MGPSLHAEMFFPAGGVTEPLVRRVVTALHYVGFAYEREPGRGGEMWVHAAFDTAQGIPLEDALAAVECGADRGDEWGITLWKSAADTGAEPLDVHLGILRFRGGEPDTRSEHDDHFDVLGLALYWMPWLDDYPTLSREFLAWATFLAELSHPLYGCGYGHWNAAGLGLQLDGSAIVRGEPVELTWLSVFGPPSIERIGLKRLLCAPAWRGERHDRGPPRSRSAPTDRPDRPDRPTPKTKSQD